MTYIYIIVIDIYFLLSYNLLENTFPADIQNNL